MKKLNFLKNRIITYVLVCVSLFSSCLLAGIYAKYTSSKSDNISTKVKNFNITVNDDDTLVDFSKDLSVAMNPQSDSQTYVFTITNTSEVDISLKVTLETEGNLPLLYTYKISDGAETDFTADVEGKYYFIDTLSASVSATQTKYTVLVKWNPEYKGYAYSNGVETIRLCLYAEQNNN